MVCQNLMIDLDQKQQKLNIKKRNTYKCAYALYEGRQLILNAFKSGIFQMKEKQEKQGKG